jgi:hypothetical protein
MTRRRLSPAEVRAEAARLSRIWAREADLIGDPERAGEFRDFAKRIERIRLTADLSHNAERG